jgi:hypothetical protein
MPTMSDLGDDFKLSFRSTGEINELFTGLVARAATDRSIRYKGKAKANRASTINALVCWVASKPPDEQRRIVREGMALLNAQLGAEAERFAQNEPPEPPRPRRRRA